MEKQPVFVEEINLEELNFYPEVRTQITRKNSQGLLLLFSLVLSTVLNVVDLSQNTQRKL